MVTWSITILALSYGSIEALWEESRRLGVLTHMHQVRVLDWGLLKCARAYAMRVGEIRNAKLVRLLRQIFAWVRMRMTDTYRRARRRLDEIPRNAKFRIGLWGSAGLKGGPLRFYLRLKNGAAPAAILIDLYG
jgi:hypothetical protein